MDPTRLACAKCENRTCSRCLPVVWTVHTRASHDKLGEQRSALRHYQQYLKEGGERVSVEERASVQKRISQLLGELLAQSEASQQQASKVAADSQTAQLAVVSVPPNARVMLDGVPWTGSGTVPAGVHRLTLSATGYDELERTIRLKADEQFRIELTLTPRAPASNPPNATTLLRDSPSSQLRTDAIAYTLGSVGVVLAGTSLATYIWNQGRFEKWEREHQALQAFATDERVAESIFARRAENNALLRSTRQFRVVWISSGIAAAGLLGTASYLLLTHEDDERSPSSSRFAVGPSGVTWSGTW